MQTNTGKPYANRKSILVASVSTLESHSGMNVHELNRLAVGAACGIDVLESLVGGRRIPPRIASNSALPKHRNIACQLSR